MRMLSLVALVALLAAAAGCSDPQAGEPVWYGIPYDADGCVVDPSHHTADLVTLEECIDLGEGLLERFEADGYRCARGCVRVAAPDSGCFRDGSWRWRTNDRFDCDAVVEVIEP